MKIVYDNENYPPAGNRIYKQEKEPEIKIKEKHTNMTDMTSEEKNTEV